MPIGAIDAAFAVERNAFKFLVWKLTREFQFTVMLAVIFWCMPLASLVTPGTLSITPKPSISLHNLPVNVPVFIDEEYLTDTNRSYADGHSLERSSSVSRIFNMLATTGELPQLDRPGALKNISYDIEVPAPLLKCRFSNDPEIAQLLDIACQELPLDLVTSCSINRLNLRYSVNASDVNTTWSRQIGYIGYHHGINQNGTIFIAIAQPSSSSPNTTVIYQTCHLYKAYVSTVVNITENIQSVRAASIRDSGTNILEGEGNLLKYDYNRFQSELGSFMQGYVMENIIHDYIPVVSNSSESVHDYPVKNSTTVDPDRESPPRNDTRRHNISSGKRHTQVRKRSWPLRPDDDSIFLPHPILERTILRTAADYSNMLDWMFKDNEDNDRELVIQKKSLTTLMEELWLNASWALMTMPDICEKVPVNITQTLWLNTYTYNPQNLFIAYGCTIIGCFLSITAGIYAVYASGKSYDNSFSSISRAMQGQGIADIFGPEKSTEKKAHRKTVARTKIKLDGRGEAQRFRTQSKAL